MVFVVRVRDQVGCPLSVKRALSRLRLRNVYEGVFVKYNLSAKKMLHLVEPWVVYGIPSKGMVEDLIKRRGHGKIDGKRVPLSDNTIIEQALGDDTGIICVEDLVHELYTVGDGFSKASAFLWPFQYFIRKRGNNIRLQKYIQISDEQTIRNETIKEITDHDIV